MILYFVSVYVFVGAPLFVYDSLSFVFCFVSCVFVFFVFVYFVYVPFVFVPFVFVPFLFVPFLFFAICFVCHMFCVPFVWRFFCCILSFFNVTVSFLFQQILCVVSLLFFNYFPLPPSSGGKFDVFVSVNNSLSASRASTLHFVVDYDCQPPVVEIDSPSIPTPGNTAALCHLTLTQASPLWLEPSVSFTSSTSFGGSYCHQKQDERKKKKTKCQSQLKQDQRGTSKCK